MWPLGGDSPQPQSIRERALAALVQADKTLKAQPDAIEARRSRTMAYLRLNRPRRLLTT